MTRALYSVLAVAFAGAFAGSPLGSSPVFADTIFEVEGARANARAGRPLSGEEGELLNRWGALSGSPGWRQRYPEAPGYYDFYYEEPRPLRRRYHRPLR